jgi:hypothetical protein
MPVSSTTLTALEAAFAAVFLGITPTFATEQTSPWIHAADRRQLASGMVPRRYTIAFGAQKVVAGGASGNADTEAEVVMEVETDYRAFRPETLGECVERDFWDLHDYLSDRLDPIVPGLMWIAPVDSPPKVEDPEKIVHRFLVQYMRARPSTV